MRSDDVSPSEMRALRGIAPQDVDRLLAGRIPAAGAELDDLTTFFRDLGDVFPTPRVEALEAEHLAAMMEAAAETSPTEAFTPATGDPQRSRSSWSVFALRRKVAAATAAVVTAFSGMAVAGVLPPPIQRVVADAARHVGIGLPGATVNDEPSDDAATPPVGPSSSDEMSRRAVGNVVGGGRRSDADAVTGSEGDSERGGDGGGAAGSDDADAGDEAEEAEEEAADEAEDADDEAADGGADRLDDEPEEEAADGGVDRLEEAVDDAQDEETDSDD